MKVKTLKVSTFALQSYKQFVKGNLRLSISEVEKKLTRNVLLAKRVGEFDNHIVYAYGKLRIFVKDNSVITCIMNHQEPIDDWELDYEKKEMLDSVLGIA